MAQPDPLPTSHGQETTLGPNAPHQAGEHEMLGTVGAGCYARSAGSFCGAEVLAIRWLKNNTNRTIQASLETFWKIWNLFTVEFIIKSKRVVEFYFVKCDRKQNKKQGKIATMC